MRAVAAYVTENSARAVFLAMSVIMVCAVAINALALQQGRHPAPFAMRWTTEEVPRTGDLASLLEADDASLGPAQEIIVDTGLILDIQRALSALGYYDGAIDGVAGGQTVAAIRAFELAAGREPTGYPSTALLAAIKLDGDRVARVTDMTDAGGFTSIEDLTRTSDDLATGGPATGGPATSGPVTGDPTTARVQRTLADLGYAPGPIDGMMGPSTRRAITDFQRDRGLPQTGELTPGLIAELDSML